MADGQDLPQTTYYRIAYWEEDFQSIPAAATVSSGTSTVNCVVNAATTGCGAWYVSSGTLAGSWASGTSTQSINISGIKKAGGGTTAFYDNCNYCGIQNTPPYTSYGSVTVQSMSTTITYTMPNNPPATGTVSPTSGTIQVSTNTTVSMQCTDPDSNLSECQTLFQTSVNGANACYLRTVTNGTGFLMNDAGGAWIQWGGSAIANSQCTVTGFSVSGNAGNYTGTFTVQFKPAFFGAKNVYEYALDSASANSGWVTKGSITINNPPVVVSGAATAYMPLGMYLTVTATGRDPDGYANIQNLLILGHYGVDGNGACYFNAQPAAGANGYVAIISDDGSAWAQNTPLPSSAIIENRACKLDLSTASFTRSGTDVTFSVKAAMKPDIVLRPPVNWYLLVGDPTVNSGWVYLNVTSYVSAGPRLNSIR
jgi:hypothetical protein